MNNKQNENETTAEKAIETVGVISGSAILMGIIAAIAMAYGASLLVDKLNQDPNNQDYYYKRITDSGTLLIVLKEKLSATDKQKQDFEAQQATSDSIVNIAKQQQTDIDKKVKIGTTANIEKKEFENWWKNSKNNNPFLQTTIPIEKIQKEVKKETEEKAKTGDKPNKPQKEGTDVKDVQPKK